MLVPSGQRRLHLGPPPLRPRAGWRPPRRRPRTGRRGSRRRGSQPRNRPRSAVQPGPRPPPGRDIGRFLSAAPRRHWCASVSAAISASAALADPVRCGRLAAPRRPPARSRRRPRSLGDLGMETSWRMKRGTRGPRPRSAGRRHPGSWPAVTARVEQAGGDSSANRPSLRGCSTGAGGSQRR